MKTFFNLFKVLKKVFFVQNIGTGSIMVLQTIVLSNSDGGG